MCVRTFGIPLGISCIKRPTPNNLVTVDPKASSLKNPTMFGSRGIILTLAVFLVSSAISSEGRASSDGLRVCIRNGCIQGKSEKGNVKGYEAWYGIPFARPPVGLLRFRVI